MIDEKRHARIKAALQLKGRSLSAVARDLNVIPPLSQPSVGAFVGLAESSQKSRPSLAAMQRISGRRDTTELEGERQ